MDEKNIAEAVELLRLDRRNGMTADEALSGASDAYGLPLIVLKNRYRLRYSQEIEEAPPTIQPIELPTIRSSRITEARRMAQQCHQKKNRHLDPAFDHMIGVIRKIGRYEFIFAGVFLRSQEVLAVYVDDYIQSDNTVLSAPFITRQPKSYLEYYTDLQLTAS
ncbi:hypothetical protein NA647_18735 [Pseudomonas stutzeri]|uniref:hypothetical protein n=1 Tax=Stutzerimonas stutzeri TaxID=316 RepID=UPI00210BDC92|nr:hypothetical protein [Stutzerimonas stutzeri]MCQ4289458.1 hypothetical protein [Stutzerimonas stutzeri]